MSLNLKQWLELANIPETDVALDYTRQSLDSAHLQQLAIMGMNDPSLMLCKLPASISNMELIPCFSSATQVVSLRARNRIGNEIEICNSSQPLLIQLIQMMPYLTTEYGDILKHWSHMMDSRPLIEIEQHPSFKRMMNGWLPL